MRKRRIFCSILWGVIIIFFVVALPVFAADGGDVPTLAEGEEIPDLPQISDHPPESPQYWEDVWNDLVAHNFPDMTVAKQETWTGTHVVRDTVIIPRGVTVTVAPGTVITFAPNAQLIVVGTLDVRGLPHARVQFVADASGHDDEKYTMLVGMGGVLRMRNTDVVDGGYYRKIASLSHLWEYIVPPVRAVSIDYVVPSLYLNEGVHAIPVIAANYGVATIDVRTTLFKDNGMVLYVGPYAAPTSRFSFRASTFDDNIVHVYNENQAVQIFTRNTYWDGGMSRTGAVSFTRGIDNLFPRLTKSFPRDPVIVIPGIMGSDKTADGVWHLDPIYHVYDNLYESLIVAGYEPGVSLFSFPYEWRDSNSATAQALAQKIADVRKATGADAVDLVAHSMGGLVARSYIEGSLYKNDVDQLITLGTPHRGAPKAYLIWEGGVWPFDVVDKMILESRFKHEAKEKGYADVFDYVHERPVASVQELLPDYSYLVNAATEVEKTYPEDHPANHFLEELNAGGGLRKMRDVLFANLVGKDDVDKTVSSINVVKTDKQKKWIHGYPLGFNTDIITSGGLNRDYGDGTVPIQSSNPDILKADTTLEFDAQHTGLPTDAQQDVIEILTGMRPVQRITKSILARKLFMVQAYSPIDLLVTAPDGKRIGTDPDTGALYDEIAGAYYTGTHTDTEFLTIPDPQEGSYRITTTGTDEGGAYTVAATLADFDTQHLVTQQYAGTSTPAQTQTHTAIITADTVTMPQPPSPTPNTSVVSTATPTQEAAPSVPQKETPQEEEHYSTHRKHSTHNAFKQSVSAEAPTYSAAQEPDTHASEKSILSTDAIAQLAEQSIVPIVAGKQVTKIDTTNQVSFSVRDRVIAGFCGIGIIAAVLWYYIKRVGRK